MKVIILTSSLFSILVTAETYAIGLTPEPRNEKMTLYFTENLYEYVECYLKIQERDFYKINHTINIYFNGTIMSSNGGCVIERQEGKIRVNFYPYLSEYDGVYECVEYNHGVIQIFTIKTKIEIEEPLKNNTDGNNGVISEKSLIKKKDGNSYTIEFLSSIIVAMLFILLILIKKIFIKNLYNKLNRKEIPSNCEIGLYTSVPE